MTDEDYQASRDDMKGTLKKEAVRICESLGLDSVAIIASGQAGENLLDSHTFSLYVTVGNGYANHMCIMEIADCIANGETEGYDPDPTEEDAQNDYP